MTDYGTIPTGPVMVTSRFDVPDGYTYDGYVRTGGYTALRKALTEMTAADLSRRGEGRHGPRPRRRRLPGRRRSGASCRRTCSRATSS